MANSMTIGQGLRRIKKLKGRMNELSSRAASSVSYESSRKPTFDFRTTREQLREVREELVLLEATVAKANATATIEVESKRMTIAEAIRHLQEIKAEIAWVSSLGLREGTVRQWEEDWDPEKGQIRRPHEVTWISDLSERDRVAEVEGLREQFDRINDAVEAANHTTRFEWVKPSGKAAAAATRA